MGLASGPYFTKFHISALRDFLVSKKEQISDVVSAADYQHAVHIR